MSDELIALQTLVAFQEQALGELTDIVTDQQKQLDRLRIEVKMMLDKLLDLEGAVDSQGAESSPRDEIPPHY